MTIEDLQKQLLEQPTSAPYKHAVQSLSNLCPKAVKLLLQKKISLTKAYVLAKHKAMQQVDMLHDAQAMGNAGFTVKYQRGSLD